MNIVMCITSLDRGGAENQVVRVSDLLAKAGHTVLIMHLTGNPDTLPNENGIAVCSLHLKKNPGSLILALIRARRRIAKFQPDVIHSHLFHANMFCRLLRLIIHIPRLVCSSHGFREKSPLRSMCYALTDFLCDMFTNVSGQSLRVSIANGTSSARTSRVLYNGIPVDRFAFSADSRRDVRARAGLDEQAFLFLAMGRLVRAKDFPLLLTAFAHVFIREANAFLWIAGDGPLLSDLTALTARLGIGDHVSFLGFRSDAPQLFSAADTFVLSSTEEGFGLVVAEAMAARCFVVATDCGGTAEVLGETGLLIPPGDSDALSEAMLRSMNMNAEVRERCLDWAEARVKALFSLEKSAASWVDAYREGTSL